MEPERTATGSLRYYTGNSAILFPIRLNGERLKLRCYTRTIERDLKRLYGRRLYERELLLFTEQGGEWVDVVVEEWIEGESLELCIERAARAGDKRGLMALSEGFDELVAGLLAEEWAHGDLKSENVVVSPSGEQHLIDFDACYLPDEGPGEAPERGTPAYQHPMRGVLHDKWIDHYPAALISAQLRALALDPTLYDRFGGGDGLLFHPEELFEERNPRFHYRRAAALGSCEAYDAVCELLATQGSARHYRLARLLQYESHRLPGVEELLAFHYPEEPLVEAEVWYDRHLAGYTNPSGAHSPLLFDEAFEFLNDRARVRIGGYWHEIDRSLRIQKP